MATRDNLNAAILADATRFHAALLALHGSNGVSIRVEGLIVTVHDDGLGVYPALDGSGVTRMDPHEAAALLLAATWRSDEIHAALRVGRVA